MAFRPRARRLWASLRAERRTLRQGLVALMVSSGGDLLAGIALASMSDALVRLPGLVVLIPAAIGMRGNVFGALGSRLGTSIHSGTFRVTRDRGGVLAHNVAATAALTLATSLFLGVAARAAAAGFGLPSISIWDFVTISVVGGSLSSLVVGSLTIVIAVASHRRRWDLDSVSAPLVTAIGDIVTLPALWAASVLARVPIVTVGVGLAAAAVSIAATAAGLSARRAEIRRIVRESLPVLAFAGVLDILAGTALGSRLEHFITYPALLILVPPFLEDTNALSGILASRLASKLHLGLIEPRPVPEPLARRDIAIQFVFALWVFAFVGLSGHFVAVVLRKASPGPVDMVGLSLVAGFLATLASSALAYGAAVASFRFGFDPDNHGIPITSSLMDLVGTGCLILGILVFGLA